MKSHIQIICYYPSGNQMSARIIESSLISKELLDALRKSQRRQPGDFNKLEKIEGMMDIWKNHSKDVTFGPSVILKETFLFYESCCEDKMFEWY